MKKIDRSAKVRTGFHQAKWDEPVIFELSQPGERGILVNKADPKVAEARFVVALATQKFDDAERELSALSKADVDQAGGIVYQFRLAMARGRYAEDLTIHHRPSPARDSTLRRRHGIRNTLWFTWLRRPVGRAMRRSAFLATTVPRDKTSLLAFAEAAAGLPWVLRERRAAPDWVERGLRALELPQRESGARTYVG